MIDQYLEKYDIYTTEMFRHYQITSEMIIDTPLAVDEEQLLSALEYFSNVADLDYTDQVFESLEELGFTEEAARDILGEAFCNAGTIHLEGRYVDKSIPNAMRYFEQGYRFGNSCSSYHLGALLLTPGADNAKLARAFECLSFSAAMDNPAAYGKLADLYSQGIYVQQNDAIAFALYSKALAHMSEREEDFCSNIHYKLGETLLYGRGTAQDIWSAVEHLQKASLGSYRLLRAGVEDASELAAHAEQLLVQARAQLKHEIL